MKHLIFSILALVLISCAPENKKIQFGVDQCEHCKMTISDPKYGAEIVTDKGKIYLFDSIECLISYYSKVDKNISNEFKSLWTVDYLTKGDLIDAKKAKYLRSEALHSPMGLNIAAFKDKNSMSKFIKSDSDIVISFSDVMEIVKKEWDL
jgi:copper chaperone NosL